jgi:hypothetical protein
VADPRAGGMIGLMSRDTATGTAADPRVAAGVLRALGTEALVLIAVWVALLRCADPGHGEAATSVLDQIAKASASNATTSRRVAGVSTASS